MDFQQIKARFYADFQYVCDEIFPDHQLEIGGIDEDIYSTLASDYSDLNWDHELCTTYNQDGAFDLTFKLLIDGSLQAACLGRFIPEDETIELRMLESFCDSTSPFYKRVCNVTFMGAYLITQAAGAQVIRLHDVDPNEPKLVAHYEKFGFSWLPNEDGAIILSMSVSVQALEDRVNTVMRLESQT
ncbi:hypothetical protein [Ferrimonas sp. YFM]|uniref:hypothetical protein n=1 Tax=Ferrimonas sp. YFM TaxID=3028878 RepID=UPI002572C947|nr:hypothetical protein [Ferrimonas sp. YFM]